MLALYLIGLVGFPLAGAPKKVDKAVSGPPILWREPADISSRDLYYGPGGAKDQPHGPFVFVKEDLNGTQPKLVIKDRDGIKWKLKFGAETRPEAAASRIVWSAGFFADEDYFLPDLVIRNMPAKLHRGDKFIEPDGLSHNARLKRYVEGEKKAGAWKWKENPFVGTRELNGLRVMMALINNWDLKDVNNAIYNSDGTQTYRVSDLGASFGSTGLPASPASGKGNLEKYEDSKFIQKVEPPLISFNVPSRPALLDVFAAKDFANRVDMQWIGKDIPIADARWLGQIMSRLSPGQIEKAFAAAGFSPQETAGFSRVLLGRIAELNQL
jgi:hypothetical protein